MREGEEGRGERERSHPWDIPHNAGDNTADRIAFDSNDINGINHFLRIFWVWASDDIALNLGTWNLITI